jgi:HSP20 family protein
VRHAAREPPGGPGHACAGPALETTVAALTLLAICIFSLEGETTMALQRYEPWSLITQLQNELERAFEDRVAHGERDSTIADWSPAVDIREEDSRFVLRADLPGVEPKDIEVTMEDGVLTLRGKRELERREQREGYRRVERVSGRFFRRFTLPDTADAEAITARSSQGVLEVSIPKQPKLQPRRIAVDAS